MRGRNGAGIAGWLAALIPLVIANLATYLGSLSFDEALQVGTIGLLASILFGGVVAGALGGRHGGGARGAARGASISATLYAISVIVLNVGASLHDSSSPQILSNPIPAVMTLVFCAALMLGVALLVGTLAGSKPRARRTPAPQRSASMPRDRAASPYGTPARPSQQFQPPTLRAAPPTIPRHEWSPYGDEPRAPYDRDDRLRTQSRRPADVMSRPTGYREDASARGGSEHYGDRRGH